MTRHKSHVKGLHPLPGGRLVSTSDDGTVRLWDVAAGKEIDRIDAGGPVVAWSGVSPDGRRLAAGAGWRVTTEMERTGDYRLRLVRLPPPPGPAFFNGKDLTGWVSASGTWKVADGELVGGGGRAANRSVVTARTYTDFEIAFRVKRTAGGGNPSFLFRAPPPDKDGRFVNGPRLMFNQATIVLNRNVDGIQNQGKGGVPLRPGEFNEVTVRCVGKRLTVTANGQAVTDGEFDIPADGVIGWQTPPKGGELTVRDIRFTDLGKAAADPDRAAAEWLLARGGRIGVSSPTTGYHDVTADKGGTLPAGPFRLNSFMLPGPQFMADADLARFRGLAALDTVALSGAAVTDAGVEHLATLPLTHLYLSRTKVTDAGLRHLKACDRLKVLHLDDTAVTDAGLAHLTGLTRLTGLRLDRAKVTKAGVEKLAAALPGCRIDWSGGAIEPTPAAVPK